MLSIPNGTHWFGIVRTYWYNFIYATLFHVRALQAQACNQVGVTDQTYYRWRKEYGGLKVDQAKLLKELEKENTKLQHLVAESFGFLVNVIISVRRPHVEQPLGSVRQIFNRSQLLPLRSCSSK